MAKQQGSGVVAAARRVSDTQGRFQDLGGQFMTGYNKSLETKKAKEAESEATLGRVNALMDGFTNDIDVIKFKPEDQTVVKNKITAWRNEYAGAANAAAKIKDKSSSEYQQYVDVMNGIQSKMVNLKNNIDGLAAFKGEYAENVKSGTYSIAGQNAMSLAQGETMVTSPIGSISDDGDLQWNAGVGSVREGFSFGDYSKPFAKANNVALELDKIATPLTTMKTPLTKFDKDYINERVNNLVGNDPNTLASIIADGELKSFNFTDIDPDDPNAKDMVVDRLVQAMYDARGSRVTRSTGSSSTDSSTSSGEDDGGDGKDKYDYSRTESVSMIEGGAVIPIKTGRTSRKAGRLTVKLLPEAGKWVLADEAGVPIKDGDAFALTFDTEEQLKQYIK